MRFIVSIIIVVSLIVSCNSSTQTETISKSWNKDSTYKFSFEVKDTSLRYSVNLIVYNTNNYEYSNLYLIVKISNISTSFENSLNYALANDKGEWLGKRFLFGSYKSSLRYIEKGRFVNTGIHTISIKHGMRQDNLIGINKIGINIVAESTKK